MKQIFCVWGRGMIPEELLIKKIDDICGVNYVASACSRESFNWAIKVNIESDELDIIVNNSIDMIEYASEKYMIARGKSKILKEKENKEMRDGWKNKIEMKKVNLKPFKRDSISEKENKSNQDFIADIKTSLMELIRKIQMIELGENNQEKKETKKTKILVNYKSGKGRHLENADYMQAYIPGYGRHFTLYAETLPDPNDEVGTYEELKEEILKQALCNFVDANELMFWFDE